MHNSMKLAGFKDEEEIKRRTDEALRLVDLGKYQHKVVMPYQVGRNKELR